MIGHVQLGLLIMGALLGHWQLYLFDFAENWLEGVYMYQDDTCEIISPSVHPPNSMIKNPNAPCLSLDEAY